MAKQTGTPDAGRKIQTNGVLAAEMKTKKRFAVLQFLFQKASVLYVNQFSGL